MNGDNDRGICTRSSSLAKLVQDPLVGLMMASDGVDRRTIELLFEQISCRRSRGACRAPPAWPSGEAPFTPAEW
jgi:hypothetical protein